MVLMIILQPLIIHSVNDPLVRGTDFNYEYMKLLSLLNDFWWFCLSIIALDVYSRLPLWKECVKASYRVVITLTRFIMK